VTVVREFHEAFDLTINDSPSVPSEKDIRLRIRLIKEETNEVCDELIRLLKTPRLGDAIPVLQALLSELCDLRYVTEGTAVTLGLPMDEAYEAIHAANMAKVWPDGRVHRDSGGKVVKPPNHEKANMADFVCIIDTTGEEDAGAQT
jgi:predicted HAD superfamily Cof-like phosphohydrolase